MVFKRLRGSLSSEEIGKEILDSNPTISLVLRILENHLGDLANDIFIKSSAESGVAPSKINKDTIVRFSEAVEKHASELLGDVPAKYLKVNLQKSV
ncbi:MAG: hypothetical protein ACXAE3_15010 [Candidatus Kariarchaeaceae archaeon]|jgi:hypothetical protein